MRELRDGGGDSTWSRSAFAFFNFSASDGVGVKIGEIGDGAIAASSSDEPSESESNEIAEFFDSGRVICI